DIDRPFATARAIARPCGYATARPASPEAPGEGARLPSGPRRETEPWRPWHPPERARRGAPEGPAPRGGSARGRQPGPLVPPPPRHEPRVSPWRRCRPTSAWTRLRVVWPDPLR